MNQHHTGSDKQTPAKKILNKQHGGKHHKMSPVIDSAIHTATVLHEKLLKWTEKQNTNVVTQKEKHGTH